MHATIECKECRNTHATRVKKITVMFFKSNRLEMEKRSTKDRLSVLDELGIKGLERMPSNFNIFKPLLNVIPLTIETKKKIEARQSTFLGSAESTDSAVKIK